MGRLAKFSGILVLSCMTSSFSYGDDLVSILQLALENDPTLRQAEANYRENREGMIQSRASLLPSIGLGGSTSRLTSGPIRFDLCRCSRSDLRPIDSNPSRRGSQF